MICAREQRLGGELPHGMLKVHLRVPSERPWPRPKVHFQLNRSVQEKAVEQRLAKLLALVLENTVKSKVAAHSQGNIDTVKTMLEAHLLEYIGNTEALFVSASYSGIAQ